MRIDESTLSAKTMLSKVPEVTIFFWIIKIMATTVGETAADFLSTNLHLGLTATTLVSCRSTASSPPSARGSTGWRSCSPSPWEPPPAI